MRKYFAVFDTKGHAWGTGYTTAGAIREAKRWTSRYEDVRLKTPKQIAPLFFRFINENGGNKKELKQFKGQKYLK